MSENVMKQYEEIIDYIEQFSKFASRIRGRWIYSFSFMLLHNYFKIKTIDLLRGNQPSYIIKNIKTATSEEEKKSKFFKILTSEYIIDALSTEIENKFPHVNFKKLKKLHELKSKQLLRWNVKSTFGVIFGLGTLLLRTIPEPVIKQFCNYDDFQIITFLVMIGFLAYTFILLLPMLIKYSDAKEKHKWIGEVLDYTEIRINSK